MNNALNNCVWIGADGGIVSPIILRKFNVEGIKKASLFITGLGYFEAKINDKSVTDYKFLPVITDYEPRDLTLCAHKNTTGITTNRIYYYNFDVTSLLNNGNNTLSIQLGNGFYRQEERVAEGKMSFGDTLKCIYKIIIETENETIELCSDGSETYTDSAIRFSNIYLGEMIDYSIKLLKESQVNVLPSPNTILNEAIGTPDKVIRTIRPKKIAEINGRHIFDAGENITGVVEVKTNSTVTLRFAENINDDMSLNFTSSTASYRTTRSGELQIMTDTFISDGTPRIFEAKFTFHAFRYFDVYGKYDDLTVKVIHADTPVTSTFTSNHEGMNFLYNAFLRTQLDNMHGSIPSDCPHRERLGYTGDGQLVAQTAMMMLDSKEFYKKWIQDILDCQDTDGHVRHTAPFLGGGGGPGGWGSAIVIVPYAYYKQYGDTEIIKHCYDKMKLWINYLLSHSENGLVISEDAGGWCLGDWASLEKMEIPEPYVNSCYLVKNLLLLEEMAELVDKSDDIPYYQTLRNTTEKAIVNTYYDTASGHFAGGIQGADAFAVWCGLAGAETAKRLADRYTELKYFDTGFLCTDILCEVLCNYGYTDVFLSLLESEKLGSFLYMKRHGATTIWEYFIGKCSHNHPMFGACTRQLFQSVLGIRQREGTAGYTDVIINPIKTTPNLRVSGSIDTPNGVISVSIDTTGETPIVKIDAPQTIKLEIIK
ncbi:MAG: family 78 glycoside hydrolase catalytic domain [Clostridia bacterium]|nr:family 78 glycoside hydrolase catalytic domain [Clostridia bacterium]